MKASDLLIDELVNELVPVRPVSTARALALVTLLVAVQALVAFALGDMRADLSVGAPPAILLWRILFSAAFAGLAVTIVMRLRSPIRTTRGWASVALALALVAVASGWALDLVYPTSLSLMARIRPLTGLHCIAVVVANGLPLLALIVVLMRQGAVVLPGSASAWAGLAAAATGGLIWALACPIDDTFYATLWYALAFTLLTGAARWLLPPTISLHAQR